MKDLVLGLAVVLTSITGCVAPDASTDASPVDPSGVGDGGLSAVDDLAAALGDGGATPPPSGAVVLTVEVVGEGKVHADTGSLSCPGDCNEGYAAGTVVQLTASAQAGSVFLGWAGACRGLEVCRPDLAASARVFAVFMPRGSTGTSYYVATDGSDAANGTSPTTAYRTIGKALSVVMPGDTIDVRAGTYNEHIKIDRPGSASAGIALRAYGDERPVLVSGGIGPTVYVRDDACDVEVIGTSNGNVDCRPYYYTLMGLEVRGGQGGGGDGNAIKIDVPKVRVVGNRLCCTEADVVKVVRTANDVEIVGNEIFQDPAVVVPSDNAQGVDAVGADRLRVAANWVHDVHDIGIYAKGNCRSPVFENNLLTNIGVHALMLGQETDEELLLDGHFETYDGVVRNNVVVGTDWACLAVSSSQNARLYNNSCYDTGRVTHGSILLSNESIVGQASDQIEIRNNALFGSANRPILTLTSNAIADLHTLLIDHNVYFSTGGAPTFSPEDSALGFAAWQARYSQLSGRVDGSVVADPQFVGTTGPLPLGLSPGSPARGGGVASVVVPTDAIGTTRPVVGPVDVGAYQY